MNSNLMHVPFRGIVIGLALTMALVLRAADFVDTFDTADNVGSTFGGLSASVSGGQLTLTRTAASVDMGLDWRPASTGLFSLADTPNFRIDAASAVTGGYYTINVLFFNSSGDFLSETPVQADTNATGVFTYDLASLAGGATQWLARVRVNPFDQNGAGFIFNEFAATTPVPEPSTYAAFFGAVTLAGAFVARRRQGKRIVRH